MKKFIILPMFALCAMAANAQDFDSKPTVTIDNEQEDLHFTVGARFMARLLGYFIRKEGTKEVNVFLQRKRVQPGRRFRETTSSSG